MTNGYDIAPQGEIAASAAVAESLSTVGYAMFALLQNGPLENIPSLTEFMAQVRADQQAADRAAAQAAAQAAEQQAAAQAAEQQAAEQQAAYGATQGSSAFLDAVPTQSSIPRPAPIPVTATGVQVPVGPPVTSTSDTSLTDDRDQDTLPDAAAYPQPKNPLGSVPEYTGNHTIQMLQEISFLEE